MTIVDGPIVPFDSNTTFDEQRTSFDINQGKYVDPVYSSQVSSVFAGYDSRPKQSLPGMGSDTPPSYVPFAERVDSQVPYHPTSLENAVYQSSSVDINPLDANPSYSRDAFDSISQTNPVSSGYDSTIPVASNFDGRSHSFYPTPPNSADYQSPSVDFDPMNTNSIQSGDAFDSSSRASIVSEGPSAAATSLDYIKPVYHQIEDVQTSSYRDMNPYSTQGNYLGSLVKNPLVYSASGETVMDGPILPFDGGER
eukprot:TRINITY_DN1168_c1_g1_i3.p1 TRINITY_DN1168_c1_g1~~TRINITY_DN1168_c1_g1_i3.p1  ORF type:complete len:253 (+),score=21.71 TRINITY_DN1168_c1_g1_i3:3-761(+)